jgi:hypothetical protein
VRCSALLGGPRFWVLGSRGVHKGLDPGPLLLKACSMLAGSSPATPSSVLTTEQLHRASLRNIVRGKHHKQVHVMRHAMEHVHTDRAHHWHVCTHSAQSLYGVAQAHPGSTPRPPACKRSRGPTSPRGTCRSPAGSRRGLEKVQHGKAPISNNKLAGACQLLGWKGCSCVNRACGDGSRIAGQQRNRQAYPTIALVWAELFMRRLAGVTTKTILRNQQ